MTRLSLRVADWVLPITSVAFIPLLLAADADGDWMRQLWLGLLTTALLLVFLRREGPTERAVVIGCVVISTAVELFATQVWGVYAYRLGNVPLFVPPGHGLLCLLGITAARLPVAASRPRMMPRLAFSFAAVWAVLGLTVLPSRFGQPLDVLGAMFLPWFAFLLFRTERASEYAFTFLGASFVELVGVFFSNWHWSAQVPLFEFGCGNPPSAAGGGYCWFGYLALFGLSIAGRHAPPWRADGVSRLSFGPCLRSRPSVPPSPGEPPPSRC